MWRARLARHALGCSKRNAELKARRLVAERAILVLISGREVLRVANSGYRAGRSRGGEVVKASSSEVGSQRNNEARDGSTLIPVSTERKRKISPSSP